MARLRVTVDGIEHTRAGRRAAVTAAAIAAAAFAVLAVLVATKWGPLMRLDHRIDVRLNDYVDPHRGQVRFWSGVSAVLSPAVLRTALLVVAAGLLYYRRIRATLFLAGVSLGSLVLSAAAKTAVGRPRPVVPHPIDHLTDPSFPSGHALTSAAVALAVVLIAWPRLGRWGRVAVTAIAFVLAAAVAFSRLMLGVHYLSDVVGGWLAAAALVFALAAVPGVPDLRWPLDRR